MNLTAWAGVRDEHVWRWALPRAGNLSASSARRVTLRARWTGQTSLESMSSTGWTTLVDGPVSAGDFSASWMLDFQQSLVRQEGLNLVLDLALEGVVAEEGNAWNALGHEVPDSLGLMCAPQAPGAAPMGPARWWRPVGDRPHCPLDARLRGHGGVLDPRRCGHLASEHDAVRRGGRSGPAAIERPCSLEQWKDVLGCRI